MNVLEIAKSAYHQNECFGNRKLDRTANLSDYYNDNVWAMGDLLEDVGIAIEDAVRNKKK